MNSRQWPLFVLAMVLWLLGSCTEADLELDSPYSHIGNVRFSYDWSGTDAKHIPDSMVVMAVRVVNHYKRGMVVSTENLRGHYFYNAPENIEPWVDPSTVPPTPPPPTIDNNYTIDPTEPNNGGDDPSTLEPSAETEEQDPEVANTTIEVDHFTLPDGTYKFYAVGADEKLYDHVYTNLSEYMASEGTGMQYSEVELVYNTHQQGEENFTSMLAQDNNQGFDYILPDYPAVFIDRLELMEVTEGQEMAVTFTPKALTQNIDIYFDIEKDVSKQPFSIEQVVGEISGIPSKATAFDGHLYLAKTNKMQFTTTLTDQNGTTLTDTPTNNTVRVHANINVLSILHSSKPTDLTGPGIMQLSITYKFSKMVNNEQKDITRTVSGKLNLYHVLKEANLIAYSTDMQYATKSCDHAVLDIPYLMKVSAEGIASASGEGGFNGWEQIDDPDHPVTDNDGDKPEIY